MGPCMLEESRGQGERRLQEWHHGMEVGGGQAQFEAVMGEHAEPFAGELAILGLGPGSAMCRQQRTKVQL